MGICICVWIRTTLWFNAKVVDLRWQCLMPNANELRCNYHCQCSRMPTEVMASAMSFSQRCWWWLSAQAKDGGCSDRKGHKCQCQLQLMRIRNTHTGTCETPTPEAMWHGSYCAQSCVKMGINRRLDVSVASNKVWLMKANSTTTPATAVKIAKFENST